MSLEGAFEELERIVGLLEGGRLSLEDSLDLFERGMRLIRLSNARLDGAERRIECLSGELPQDIIDGGG
ncbi:MAG: exodeoxyribonuclease VII small subunit [Methanotrichaceae archaeon]|nr:exodeoxyribonuclease VII small subunit [Methanotrichaceae archaeon]